MLPGAAANPAEPPAARAGSPRLEDGLLGALAGSGLEPMVPRPPLSSVPVPGSSFKSAVVVWPKRPTFHKKLGEEVVPNPFVRRLHCFPGGALLWPSAVQQLAVACSSCSVQIDPVRDDGVRSAPLPSHRAEPTRAQEPSTSLIPMVAHGHALGRLSAQQFPVLTRARAAWMQVCNFTARPR